MCIRNRLRDKLDALVNKLPAEADDGRKELGAISPAAFDGPFARFDSDLRDAAAARPADMRGGGRRHYAASLSAAAFLAISALRRAAASAFSRSAAATRMRCSSIRRLISSSLRLASRRATDSPLPKLK